MVKYKLITPKTTGLLSLLVLTYFGKKMTLRISSEDNFEAYHKLIVSSEQPIIGYTNPISLKQN